MAGKTLFGVTWRTPQAVLAGWNPSKTEQYRCFWNLEEAERYVKKVQSEAMSKCQYGWTPDKTQQIGMPHVGCIAQFKATEQQLQTCREQGFVETKPSASVHINPYRLCFGADAVQSYLAYNIEGTTKRYDGQRGMKEYAQARMDVIQQEYYRLNPHVVTAKFQEQHVAYAVMRANSLDIEEILHPIHCQALLFSTPEAALQHARQDISSWDGHLTFRAHNIPHGFCPPKAISLKFETAKPCIIYPINLSAESAKQFNWTNGTLGPIGFDKQHVEYARIGNPIIVLHDGQKDHIITPGDDAPQQFTARVAEELQSFTKQMQQKADALYTEYRKQYDAERGSIPYTSGETLETIGNATEMANPDTTSVGWKLVQRWSDTLRTKGYQEFAKELKTLYSRNVMQHHNADVETKMSAYKAMETVFSKVQRAAAKQGDYETATAAQQIARFAGNALYDMRNEGQPQSTGISREEAAQYGIHIPEEEEVCV